MRVSLGAVAAAAVFLICGCVSNDSSLQVDCKKLVDRDVQEQCFYNKSLAKLDSNMCQSIMSEKLKEDCINNVAVKLMDYIVCRQHDRASQRDRCEKVVGEARKKAREEDPNVKLP